MFFITTHFTQCFKHNNSIHLIYKTVNTFTLKNCNKSNQIAARESKKFPHTGIQYYFS